MHLNTLYFNDSYVYNSELLDKSQNFLWIFHLATFL